MGHIESLQQEYPDTTIEGNSCGPRVLSFVLQVYGKPAPSVREIEHKVGLIPGTSGVTMLQLQRFIESNELYALPVSASLGDLNDAFESGVFVLHAQGVRDEGHFYAYLKRGESAYLIDPPDLNRTLDIGAIDATGLSRQIEYTGSALVIGTAPVNLSAPVLSTANVAIGVTAALALVILWRLGRKKLRGANP